MARIRTIKPDFFTSEDIVLLSPLARLFYIALWCEADKEGRFAWKPKTFKLRYLPGDNCDIEALADELLNARLVVLYEGGTLAYIPSFGKHQHVNPRESATQLPAPPNYEPAPPKRIAPDVRSEVMERDGGKCVRCNATEDLTLDHILPQSCEGPHINENLRVMCRACNSSRPVSGQGLVDDLALDGLTVQGLREKFGLAEKLTRQHASARVNSRNDPQVGREGKGKERKGTHDAHGASGFDEFWEAWPKSERKQDKAKCAEKWKAHDLKAVLPQILADIEVKKRTEKWRGGFIEAPEVYLNNRRWEDGVTPGNEDLSAASLWTETRSGIVAKGIALGCGQWDEYAASVGQGEPFSRYKARVFKAAGVEELAA